MGPKLDARLKAFIGGHDLEIPPYNRPTVIKYYILNVTLRYILLCNNVQPTNALKRSKGLSVMGCIFRCNQSPHCHFGIGEVRYEKIDEKNIKENNSEFLILNRKERNSAQLLHILSQRVQCLNPKLGEIHETSHVLLEYNISTFSFKLHP